MQHNIIIKGEKTNGNKATENISCIDSEPYASLSVFSTDDEYIAARIYTENGEIVTDWCC